jgi:hypothetical protein
MSYFFRREVTVQGPVGVTLFSASAYRKGCVCVALVLPHDASAREAELFPGDVLLSINGIGDLDVPTASRLLSHNVVLTVVLECAAVAYLQGQQARLCAASDGLSLSCSVLVRAPQLDGALSTSFTATSSSPARCRSITTHSGWRRCISDAWTTPST